MFGSCIKLYKELYFLDMINTIEAHVTPAALRSPLTQQPYRSWIELSRSEQFHPSFEMQGSDRAMGGVTQQN